MYKTLLSDYDTRQREMLLENAELKKVLQQIKIEMVSILSLREPIRKDAKYPDAGIQVGGIVFLFSLMQPFNSPTGSFCQVIAFTTSPISFLIRMSYVVSDSLDQDIMQQIAYQCY